jgi:hypothetical protein
MVTEILDNQKNLTFTQSSENGPNQINELYPSESLSGNDTYSLHRKKKFIRKLI